MSSKPINIDVALRILHLLEQNNMSVAKTVTESGVKKSTIYKYKRLFWQKYIERKQDVKRAVREKLVNDIVEKADFDKQRQKITSSVDRAMQLMNERLEDEDRRIRISDRDLAAYIGNMMQYIAEKPGITPGDRTDDLQTRKKTIINNILNHTTNTVTNNTVIKEEEKDAKNSD